jgi:hypothetical protein
MANPLIGIHAGLGEFGIFVFLWMFVELLNPTAARIKRAKIACVIGLILIILSWLAGGYYYVNIYGPEVKPLIKEGPAPWAHLVFTETKEHIFLFIPILSMLITTILFKADMNKARKSILMLLGLTILLGLSMAGMGYIISTGARTALEALV